MTLGENSAATIVRTAFLRNSTGLKVDRTVDARLEAVTVSDSAADGLVLRGDRGTTLIGIKAESNGGNGVLVTGPPLGPSDHRDLGVGQQAVRGGHARARTRPR